MLHFRLKDDLPFQVKVQSSLQLCDVIFASFLLGIDPGLRFFSLRVELRWKSGMSDLSLIKWVCLYHNT